MIVVFDSLSHRRAEALRDLVFDAGYPCAVCDSETVGALLPVGLVITFADQTDEVRKLTTDGVPVIVYGGGFVNTAQNAVNAETAGELFDAIREVIRRRFDLNRYNSFFGGCAFFYPGVYLTSVGLTVYGSPVNLTEHELYVMRCLILSGNCYRTAVQLAAYCTKGKVSESCIRTHVCGINRKGSRKLPRPLIESRRGRGYRFGYIPETEPS